MWLGLIMLLGDDIVFWLVGVISTDLHRIVADWGAAARTLLFGVGPAAALAVAILRRDWCECWRQTKALE